MSDRQTGCPHCGNEIGCLTCPACHNTRCMICRVKKHPDYLCIRCQRFITHPETIGKNDPLPEDAELTLLTFNVASKRGK